MPAKPEHVSQVLRRILEQMAKRQAESEKQANSQKGAKLNGKG